MMHALHTVYMYMYMLLNPNFNSNLDVLYNSSCNESSASKHFLDIIIITVENIKQLVKTDQ